MTGQVVGCNAGIIVVFALLPCLHVEVAGKSSITTCFGLYAVQAEFEYGIGYIHMTCIITLCSAWLLFAENEEINSLIDRLVGRLLGYPITKASQTEFEGFVRNSDQCGEAAPAYLAVAFLVGRGEILSDGLL